MENNPKMTNTEIYRWGSFKTRGLADAQQATEFQRLDSKWNQEKIDLVTAAVQKLQRAKNKSSSAR